ncbi:hypothetical protein EAI_00579 [Harpegnathos saltator]|uniref:Uncharacterized protein n=3 Tax=Harpegnathos saltator TaxID=610380 RepID=E2C2E6_HARSA|nr:hypothetical protein EAI_00579 [Harpegnathos saltator]
MDIIVENTVENESVVDNGKENTIHDSSFNVSTFKEVTTEEWNIRNENKQTTRKRKFVETEDTLKIKRIKQIIDQEHQLAEMKLRHEKIMYAMKETHLKEINKLELRASVAKAELAELLLEKEKERK